MEIWPCVVRDSDTAVTLVLILKVIFFNLLLWLLARMYYQEQEVSLSTINIYENCKFNCLSKLKGQTLTKYLLYFCTCLQTSHYVCFALRVCYKWAHNPLNFGSTTPLRICWCGRCIRSNDHLERTVQLLWPRSRTYLQKQCSAKCWQPYILDSRWNYFLNLGSHISDGVGIRCISNLTI